MQGRLFAARAVSLCAAARQPREQNRRIARWLGFTRNAVRQNSHAISMPDVAGADVAEAIDPDRVLVGALDIMSVVGSDAQERTGRRPFVLFDVAPRRGID